MFTFRKKKTFLKVDGHKFFISNEKLLDKFDYKYFDLHKLPIEQVKKILYRWLKEKKLFHLYVKDSNLITASPKVQETLYSLFQEQKLKSDFWSAVEFAFFQSFK